MEQKFICEKFTASFPALSYKNFRYFWFGQCISLIGTWMQNIGQSWLVYKITDSPFMLGLVGTLQFAPVLVLSLFAGVVIDRFNKRNILLFTQTVSMALAAILGLLVYLDKVQYWHILILAALLGIMNTYDMPARQAFMVELVGKKDLLNAIALNSTIFNAARIVGPGLAGVLMGRYGIAFCFFTNSLSYIAVIIGLLRIEIEPVQKRIVRSGILQDIKEGIKYVIKTPALVKVLILVAIMGTFAMNFSVMVPVLAKTVLGQEEEGFGLLLSAMGVGSLTGAVVLTVKSRTIKRNIILAIAPLVSAMVLIATGLVNTYYISALLMIMSGLCNTSFFTTANSHIQTSTEDKYRGRVMSLYSLLFAGTTPIGNFFAGAASEKYGISSGFVIMGSIIVILVAGVNIINKKLYNQLSVNSFKKGV